MGIRVTVQALPVNILMEPERLSRKRNGAVAVQASEFCRVVMHLIQGHGLYRDNRDEEQQNSEPRQHFPVSSISVLSFALFSCIHSINPSVVS